MCGLLSFSVSLNWFSMKVSLSSIYIVRVFNQDLISLIELLKLYVHASRVFYMPERSAVYRKIGLYSVYRLLGCHACFLFFLR